MRSSIISPARPWRAAWSSGVGQALPLVRRPCSGQEEVPLSLDTVTGRQRDCDALARPDGQAPQDSWPSHWRPGEQGSVAVRRTRDSRVARRRVQTRSGSGDRAQLGRSRHPGTRRCRLRVVSGVVPRQAVDPRAACETDVCGDGSAGRDRLVRGMGSEARSCRRYYERRRCRDPCSWLLFTGTPSKGTG